MPPHTLFVLADRWDGLGARLTPMTNAIAAAEALGAEFRFVWPRRADSLDYPASRLLSTRFCARHEVRGGVAIAGLASLGRSWRSCQALTQARRCVSVSTSRNRSA